MAIFILHSFYQCNVINHNITQSGSSKYFENVHIVLYCLTTYPCIFLVSLHLKKCVSNSFKTLKNKFREERLIYYKFGITYIIVIITYIIFIVLK